MLEALSAGRRAVGLKQSRKALRQGQAQRVFLACDADPRVTDPIAAECAASGVSVVTDYTMSQLGRACGISVGAAAAALL